MCDLRGVPGEAVAQERDEVIGADGVPGLVLVQDLDHAAPPHPGTMRESPVEVPQDRSRHVPHDASRAGGVVGEHLLDPPERDATRTGFVVQ